MHGRPHGHSSKRHDFFTSGWPPPGGKLTDQAHRSSIGMARHPGTREVDHVLGCASRLALIPKRLHDALVVPGVRAPCARDLVQARKPPTIGEPNPRPDVLRCSGGQTHRTRTDGGLAAGEAHENDKTNNTVPAVRCDPSLSPMVDQPGRLPVDRSRATIPASSHDKGFSPRTSCP